MTNPEPETSGGDRPALEEWTAGATRLAPLVDGVEYYRALRESLLRAREQVWIVGWDLHTGIDLLRGREAREAEERDGYPVALGELLEALVKERPDLRVQLLIWEGSALFALDRQVVPSMKRPWVDTERLRLEWDRSAPPMGSQHQKLVVVDDRVAFVGGMDLTQARWDDHDHQVRDPRRRLPGLFPAHGDPYHDIMLAVDGEAARCLGSWARERWRRGTGNEPLGPVEPGLEPGDPARDPWPPGVAPLLRDREVHLALTTPGFRDREEVRQVEASLLDQIRRARRLLYLENQYFSSEAICEALAERLREKGGPEVVLVLPYGCPETVQALVLDTRRDVLLRRLREADGEGRFSVYWPTLRAGSREDVHAHSVFVHAKTMVVDDTLLRIGSANLANRSMGLDSELDAWVEVAEDDEAGRAAIAGYRRRLLSYFLGVPPEAVAEAEASQGALWKAIERLRDGQRSLHPLDHRASVPSGLALPIELADPDRVLSSEDVLRTTRLLETAEEIGLEVDTLPEKAMGWMRRHARKLAVAAVLLAAVAVWGLTPVREWIDADAVGNALDRIRQSPLGLAGVVAAFWVAGAVGVPVTLLIATVAGAFGAAYAVAISLAGVAGSATLGFAAGHLLRGESTAGRFGGRLEPIVRRIRDRSVLALAVLRNLPIAPYALVNVACGAAGLTLASFLAGTLIGMGPGIVLASLFGQELAGWIAEPTFSGLLRAAGALALLVGAAMAADRWLRRTRSDDDPDEQD